MALSQTLTPSGAGPAAGSRAPAPARERRAALLLDVLGNAALALLLTAAAMSTFWLVGYRVDPAEAAVLRTPLDDAIPFWPWTVYLYSWVYTSMLYPLFVIRCRRLFRRVLGAYAVAIAVTLATFALFPVTSLQFRPDPTSIDTSTFHGWGVRLTYFVDPPTNLFPSLHLTAALLSMLGAWKARRLWGMLAIPIALAVAISICTMKQHYIVDGLASLVVAGGAYGLFIRPYRPEPGARVAHGWPGPLAYFVFHGLVYLALFIAYRAGFAPWQA